MMTSTPMRIRWTPSMDGDLDDLELHLLVAKTLEAHLDPLHLSWLLVGKLQQNGICRPAKPFHNYANED